MPYNNGNFNCVADKFQRLLFAEYQLLWMHSHTASTGDSYSMDWIHLQNGWVDTNKIVLPVPEDDLPLPLPLLSALPLVCEGSAGDLYGETITRFKPGAKPGERKVARF